MGIVYDWVCEANKDKFQDLGILIRKIWGFDLARQSVITNDYQIKGFDMTNMLGLFSH